VHTDASSGCHRVTNPSFSTRKQTS